MFGMKFSFTPVAAAALALAGCIPGAKEPKPNITDRTSFSAPNAQQCLSNLASGKVSFRPLANRDYGGGCKAHNAVELLNFGTPTTNLGPMTCTLASGFAGWTRDSVRPAARKLLGSGLARIETSGTYSCRRVNGSGNLSQHAHANAVDVFAFVLEDGRKITVQNGWNGNSAEHRFLQQIHREACGRFGTVLGPAYNKQHADHLHLDMAPSRLNGNAFCR
jgi:hypothetical protein